MALLSFPPAPNNGDLYPLAPLPGQPQYQWSGPNQTWVLLGSATGVAPGCYGDGANVASFCVDAQGRIVSAVDVPISAVTPDLQTVTTQGSVTTDTIDVGGLVAAGLNYPTADSTAGNVLTTDGAGNLTLTPLPLATNATPGLTTLVNSVTSTVITAAATPNSVALAYGVASGALPKTGGTMTGDIIMSNAKGVVFGDLDVNTVKLSASPFTANDYSIFLPPNPPTVSGQVLASDLSGNLSWTTPLRAVPPPASQGSPGVIGDIAFGPTYFYWFDGASWQRVAADPGPW